MGRDCACRVFAAKTRRRNALSVASTLDHLLADDAILLAVSSATVFAIASMTSSASSVSTLSQPACPILNRRPRACPCGGGGRNMTPGESNGSTVNLAHTLPRDPVSACLPPPPLHRCIGLRVRSLNGPHDARLRPFNRHTREPAAASGANSTHAPTNVGRGTNEHRPVRMYSQWHSVHPCRRRQRKFRPPVW